MKKLFYLAIVGLSLELEASEVKDPLQEISKEEDRHMSAVAAVESKGRVFFVKNEGFLGLGESIRRVVIEDPSEYMEQRLKISEFFPSMETTVFKAIMETTMFKTIDEAIAKKNGVIEEEK